MHAAASIDALLGDSAATGGVPGVVAMATDTDGIIYEGAAGKRDLIAGSAMNIDTIVRVVSMTKPIAATAALQQVERGRIALDEPVGRILPALAEPKVLQGFDDAGRPQLRPARRPITLRHLLTHTAGFSLQTWNRDIQRYLEATGTPPPLTCRAASLSTPLVFEPGERWEYGIGIDWAGRLVEALSGQSLEAYLAEHVLAPLGMTDTAFRLGPAQRGRLASMHLRQADGSLAPIPFALPDEPEFFSGGAGLYSTARDYLAFCRMWLNDGIGPGGRVLRPETVAMAVRNQIGDLTVGPLRSVAPAASHDIDFFPGMGKQWGLSFLINSERTPAGRSPGSLAWLGIGTFFWIDRTRGFAGTLLTQMLPLGDPRLLDLFQRFEAAIYA